MTLRKIKLTIAYDGSDYHGWQNQPGRKTIQGLLAEAVKKLTGSNIQITGASRTDAGVSALAQAASIEIDSPIPAKNFPKAINNKLPRDIVVTDAEQIPLDFDIIKAVKTKLYRYSIYNGKKSPVLHIKHCWHIPSKLDISSMETAAKHLLGKNDFKSFAAAADKRKTTIRTLFRCDITCENQWLYFDVEGDGFLYNMVRNIVGTLVDVGQGRIKPDNIEKILKAKDRTAAGQLAPAQGLCLMWIKYD